MENMEEIPDLKEGKEGGDIDALLDLDDESIVVADDLDPLIKLDEDEPLEKNDDDERDDSADFNIKDFEDIYDF